MSSLRGRFAVLLCSVLSIAIGTFCFTPAQAQTGSIDTNRSKIIVHVSKAGLFSAFGDNHEVEAPISEGFVDEAAGRVKLVIESRRLRVLDPQLSPDKRQQVQDRMLGPDVLDAMHFPRITFTSSGVEPDGPGRFHVHGQLSLHGQVHPVIVNVRSEGGRYVGTCTFRQRQFGITPVSIAGGMVKVKDELRIEFEVRTASAAASTHSR